MHQIALHRPEIAGRKVTFRWTIDPATSLYQREQFTLAFPAEVDLERVAEGIWWRIALISDQVQRDLQYSCWRVKPGQAVCQACSQCLRIAFTALAIHLHEQLLRSVLSTRPAALLQALTGGAQSAS